MSTFPSVVLVLTVPLIMACNEYPPGAVVAVQLKGVSMESQPIKEFTSWLLERMKTYSAEKKDFTVLGEMVSASGAVPQGASHIFSISIDSVNLVPMAKYRESVDVANEVMEKAGAVSLVASAPVVRPIPMGPAIGGSALASIFQTITYLSAPHPTMKVSMAIRDSRTGTSTWEYTDDIDVVSTVAMSADEQLSQLLAGLKSFVADESGFFDVE